MGLGTVRAGLAGVSVMLALVGACSRLDHPPPAGTGTTGPKVPEGGLILDGAPGDGGCGTLRLPAVVDAPVLEFVFDRSGSMSEAIDASGLSKYDAAINVVGDVLASIGNRFAYGAAVFPSSDVDGSCVAGATVFGPLLGDAPSTVPAGGRGKVLNSFINRLRSYAPGGATPTAASLKALLPRFKQFKARTSVVLVTDGAPNCNLNASCGRDACIPDIEGALFGDERCGAKFSCCDPSTIGAGANGNCVDADATEEAVKALAEAGFPTYVIGMPGTEQYASVLDRLAAAGNTARSEMPRYYAVSDRDALREALLEIGVGLTIGCDIALETPPPNRELVNVYFDGQAVPFDAENGWTYGGESVVSVHGSACDDLQASEVREVKITYGCQTIVL